MNKSSEIKWALLIAFGTLVGTILATYSAYPILGYVLVSNFALAAYFGVFGTTSACERRLWSKIKRPFLS